IDGLAYSGEHLLDLFAMAALAALVHGLSRRAPSLGWVAAAGALASLGALAKQVGATSIVALGVWVVAAAVGRAGLSPRTRRALPLAYAAGAIAPIAVTVLRYALAGELHALVYYTFTYNAEVYLAPYDAKARAAAVRAFVSSHALLLALFAPVAAWGVGRPLAAAPRLAAVPAKIDEHGFTTTVALGALLSVAVSNAALRDFMHYYVQVVPWCGLLFGLVLDEALARVARASPVRGALLGAAALLPAALLVASAVSSRFHDYARDRRAHRGFDDGVDPSICAFVDRHAAPGDAVFVWGFRPAIYTVCKRRPASRFVFTTFVAGYVPWFDKATPAQDEQRVVPGSRRELVEDLEATKPPVIVEAARSIGRRGMTRSPELARYVDANYCPAGKSADVRYWLRRGPGVRCRP
ncbi:MAG TPA: hypothetical protein VHB21_15875, partial [Minicystis sp.]|nr:hypothetical protein [Minicystis sp.]